MGSNILRKLPWAAVLWAISVWSTVTGILNASDPSWWESANIIKNPSNHNVVVTVGQVKYVAVKAWEHLDSALLAAGYSEGADFYLTYITAPEDDEVALVGQLKQSALPFYNRLHTVGYSGTPQVDSTGYPWHDGTSDYDVATLGQLLHIFSFDVSSWISGGNGPGSPEVPWPNFLLQNVRISFAVVSGESGVIVQLANGPVGTNPISIGQGQTGTKEVELDVSHLGYQVTIQKIDSTEAVTVEVSFEFLDQAGQILGTIRGFLPVLLGGGSVAGTLIDVVLDIPTFAYINLLPIHFLTPEIDEAGVPTGELVPTDKLRIAKWENAFELDPFAVLPDFNETDVDRFLLKIYMPWREGDGTVQVKIKTDTTQRMKYN